jgi:hypothetical protein
MAPRVARRVAVALRGSMLRSTAADGRQAPEPRVDLLLLAALFVSALVGTLATIWIVPMLVIAALAAATDEAA